MDGMCGVAKILCEPRTQFPGCRKYQSSGQKGVEFGAIPCKALAIWWFKECLHHASRLRMDFYLNVSMYKSGLAEALAALRPKTKMARVREVMPVIEQRIAAGVRIPDILKALKDSGLELTEATLRNYLYRYRKKQGKVSAPASIQTARFVTYERDVASSMSSEPVSMEELDRLMKPDVAKQAEDLVRYERLARHQRRGRK
jgi:hypothetical protein